MDTDGAAAGRALRAPTSAEAFVAGLVRVLETLGPTRHEEEVDHLEHALQSATEARDAGGDAAAVVAALLHDIGHLLTGERAGDPDFLARDLRHEEIGARLLARWFPPEVCEPVRLHVDAKRYLCAVEPGYLAGLSEVSRHSLELQGGPFGAAGIAAFAAGPWAERAIALRLADDRAKVRGRTVPGLETWCPALLALARRAGG